MAAVGNAKNAYDVTLQECKTQASDWDKSLRNSAQHKDLHKVLANISSGIGAMIRQNEHLTGVPGTNAAQKERLKDIKLAIEEGSAYAMLASTKLYGKASEDELSDSVGRVRDMLQRLRELSLTS